MAQLETLGLGMVGSSLLSFRPLLWSPGFRAVLPDHPVQHITPSSLTLLYMSSENVSLPDLLCLLMHCQSLSLNSTEYLRVETMLPTYYNQNPHV